MRTVLIALGALAALCVPARSQDVAEFYRGKTIRIVVGIGVGSGYDINARTSRASCRHISRAIQR